MAALMALALVFRRQRANFVILRAENLSLAPYAARLESLRSFWFGASGEAFFQLDAEGRLNGANETGERLLGQRGMQLAGRPLSAFLDPDCPGLAVITSALAEGRELKRQKSRLIPRKGFDAGEVELTLQRTGGDPVEWWLLVRLLGSGKSEA